MITDADRVAFLLGVPVRVRYDIYDEVVQLLPDGQIHVQGVSIDGSIVLYNRQFYSIDDLRRVAASMHTWRGLAALLPPPRGR